MINEALNIWKDHSIKREGCRADVYRDSLGRPTVGIGHLVQKKDYLKLGDKITDLQIEDFFQKDTAKALSVSLKQWKSIGIITPEFLAALISVNFQLGDFAWKFPNTYRLLKNHQFNKAIKNLENSLWARQTPLRVNDFINAIRSIK